jgi:hypothetical protein
MAQSSPQTGGCQERPAPGCEAKLSRRKAADAELLVLIAVNAERFEQEQHVNVLTLKE